MLPIAGLSQSGSVHGFATFQSAQTNYKSFPDAGSMVYLCDSAKAEYNEPVYNNYIEWRTKVVPNPPYGHRYIGKEKLKGRQIRELFSQAKSNADSASKIFSSIRVSSMNKTIIDKDGKYDFINVPPGTYYVMIERNHNGLVFKVGECEAIKTIVKDNKSSEVNFEF